MVLIFKHIIEIFFSFLQQTHHRLSPSVKLAVASVKTYLRKEEQMSEWGGGNKESKKQQREHQGQRRRCFMVLKRRSFMSLEQISPTAHGRCCSGAVGYFLKELWPMQRPCWSRFFLKDCSPWWEPMPEQGKSVRGKEQKREVTMTIPLTNTTSSVLLRGGCKGPRMKKWSCAWEKGEERCFFKVCLYF